MVIRNLIKLTRLTVTWAVELAQQLKSLPHKQQDRGVRYPGLVGVAARLEFSLRRRFWVGWRNSARVR